MRRFGSDKPDMRFGLELVDLSDLLRNTEFKVFSGALAEGGSVRGICLKGEAEKLSRKEIDKLQEWSQGLRREGPCLDAPRGEGDLLLRKIPHGGGIRRDRSAMGAEPGDVLFLVASGTTPWCSPLSARCAASWPSASAD